MLEAGLAFDETSVWLEPYSNPGLFSRPEKRLGALAEQLKRRQPTAFVTINGAVADELMRDLISLQERVAYPEDSLVKRPLDVELASFCSGLGRSFLDVSAVYPALQLGRAAAKVLIDRLETPDASLKQHVLPMDIIEPKPLALAAGKEAAATRKA